MNIKKTASFVLIVLLTVIFSGTLSYVKAKYVDPAGAPVANNVPSPILLQAIGGFPTGVYGFSKLGKIGITSNKSTTPVDTTRFDTANFVVMGQLSTDSLAVNNSGAIIKSEVSTASSIDYPLFVGLPFSIDSSLLQKDANNNPRLMTVTDHTRAARIVIGSKTANPGNYNFYVEPGYRIWGLGHTPGYPHSFCALNESELVSKGCPSGTMMTKIVPAVSTGANVAECTDIVYQWPTYTGYRGKCY